MAYNIKDIFKDVINGDTIEMVDKEKYNNRIELCNVCEHNKLNVCTLCSCVIPFKARLVKSNCPINKW